MKRFSADSAIGAAFLAGTLGLVGLVSSTGAAFAQAPAQRLELDRKGETIVLEPYADNILRVTLSLKKGPALAGPGYGIIGTPAAAGWSATETEKANVYQSSRIVATVEKDLPRTTPLLRTQADIAKFFNGSTPGTHITLRTPEGKTLL